jgi:hypothetical protein
MDPVSEGNLKRLLLPHGYRIAGYITTLAGLIMVYLHFGRGFKPGFLDTHVFAVYSSYFDTKYFQVISNNLIEELCGISLLTGIFFIAFAKEKQEEDHYWTLRFKALLYSAYTATTILIFSFVFTFGVGFLKVAILNIYIPLIFYILIFRFLLYRDRRSQRA